MRPLTAAGRGTFVLLGFNLALALLAAFAWLVQGMRPQTQVVLARLFTWETFLFDRHFEILSTLVFAKPTAFVQLPDPPASLFDQLLVWCPGCQPWVSSATRFGSLAKRVAHFRRRTR